MSEQIRLQSKGGAVIDFHQVLLGKKGVEVLCSDVVDPLLLPLSFPVCYCA